MNCEANKCIACTVTSCKHHCDAQDYCSLSKIQVGTHECNPTMDQCTDCSPSPNGNPQTPEPVWLWRLWVRDACLSTIL